MLRNKQNLRENFNFLILEIDVIILSEIWIYNSEITSINIDDFKIFVNCKDGYRSGGVIVYLRDPILRNTGSILLNYY